MSEEPLPLSANPTTPRTHLADHPWVTSIQVTQTRQRKPHMDNPLAHTETGPARSEHYVIRIQGHLDARWSEWFDGWKVSLTDAGETVLSGSIADQAALLGLLTRVHDLGLALIAVYRIDRP